MVTANDTQPLQTPVASKRKISSIGKGKASFITWKNAIFAFLWLLLMAFISFLTFPAPTWVKGVVFGVTGVLGLCFFLIPIPGKDYYWLYNYVFDSIKFYFAKSANKMPNLGATSEFIPFTHIKGNKLYFKGESTIQGFWRLNGRNIYSCAEEIQSGLLNSYHNLLKNLHNSTIKIIGLKCNFDLQGNYKYWRKFIDEKDNRYINSAFIPISVLEWQNWQFQWNFCFYKDNREDLNMIPQPRDMVYMLVISGDTDYVVDTLGEMMLPNLSMIDGTFVEPASAEDIKMYVKKQFGMTCVDTKFGFTKSEDKTTGEEVEFFNDLFTNMHSMLFKPKYWITHDWKQVQNSSKDHYHKIITINSFKSDANIGWMDPFFEDPAIDCVQIKFQEIPIDKQTKLIGKAINQYTKVEKGATNSGSFASAKLEDTFLFLKDLEKETDRADVTLVKTTFYIKLSAPTLEKLNKKEIELKATLKKTLGLEKKCYDSFIFKQRDALLSSFGVLNDKLSKKIGINLLSSAIALGWPFNNPRVIQKSGFALGFTANGMCPVCLDLIGERSLSGMIVGKTGSGKSMLAKLLSLDIMLNPRNKLFWFDPENEMENFGYNMNGVHIDLTSTVPVSRKIPFSELKESFMRKHVTWNDDRFYFTYMTLLDIPKSYKYWHGLPNKTIKEYFKAGKYAELQSKIQQIPLIDETMDYFGLGSFKDHSKLVSIKDPQITPILIRDQILYFENEIREDTSLNNPDDLYLLYKEIYDLCIKQSNINPYRIVLSSQDDLKALNGFNLYNQHKQMLLTWFKQLCPKADAIGTTWFTTTLDKLYKTCKLKIYAREENGRQLINKSARELVEVKEGDYPTIKDHYTIMKDELYKLCEYKNSMEPNHPLNKTKDLEERIRIYNEILSVFDNLVDDNRFGERGMFYYLWNVDNKLTFTEDQRLIIFNIQNLLTNVKNIKENNYTDQIKIDFQNIFNAQYFLSQQIIWSFVVNNRINNAKEQLAPDKQSHVFIFMDEAHASLKQPQFVDWSVNLIKRARKYQAGLWLITQSIGDYLKLDDAPELFNSFMFKFYFQCEAQAFDDVLKKFEISRVPLTVSEERWLNPLLGNTTQGRCILTFEDGKRYMMTVVTSNIYIKSILERDLMRPTPYTVYDSYFEKANSYGNGIVGLLNYIRYSESSMKSAEMDIILQRSYKSWRLNNMKKFNKDLYEKWEYKNKLLTDEVDKRRLEAQKINFQKSAELAKKEKRK